MDYKAEIERVLDHLEKYSENTRLWLFQNPLALSAQEAKGLDQAMNDFCLQWTSHQRNLLARAVVAFDQILLIALDQSASNEASGCSIDSLHHAVLNTNVNYGLDLMDRMTCLYIDANSQVQSIDLRSIALSEEIMDNTLVFNNLIQSKHQLLDQWIIPISNSWHRRFLN